MVEDKDSPPPQENEPEVRARANPKVVLTSCELATGQQIVAIQYPRVQLNVIPDCCAADHPPLHLSDPQ